MTRPEMTVAALEELLSTWPELGLEDAMPGLPGVVQEAIDYINASELARRELLEDAVLCEDAEDFVRDLIKKAKELGLTKDGRTLV